MTLRIYTDGGCWPNPGYGAYAYVIVDEKDEIVAEECISVLDTTNNQMEMRAIIEGLKKVKKLQGKFEVYTDSKYCIDGIKSWVHKWKKKGWKTSTGCDVKNRDLWEELDKLTHKKTRIMHVKGHNGDRWNEYVDALCSEKVKALNGQH